MAESGHPGGVPSYGPRPTLGQRAAELVFLPIFTVVTKRRWRGTERLPRPGTGFVVCVNHISHIDPLTVAHFLFINKHHPYFLAKASLFKNKLVGRWMTAAEQIPVYRGSGRAIEAYRDAVVAVRAGRCVVVPPESTITKDPDLWPMRGKTGAARIALATGCPVIPIAQWGAHELMTPYGRLHPFPRKTINIYAGPPVDLDDLRERHAQAESAGDEKALYAIVTEATERIMATITRQLEDLRGESSPPGVWDASTGTRQDVGA